MWNPTKDVETHHLWLVFSTFISKTEEIKFLTSLLECDLGGLWRRENLPKISGPAPAVFPASVFSSRLWCESTYRSSESRWGRNPLTELWSRSGRTSAALPRPRRHNGGQPPNGRAEEITSQTPRGAPAVFCEERAGLLLVANTGRQRAVGGRGRMSSEHELLWVKENPSFKTTRAASCADLTLTSRGEPSLQLAEPLLKMQVAESELAWLTETGNKGPWWIDICGTKRCSFRQAEEKNLSKVSCLFALFFPQFFLHLLRRPQTVSSSFHSSLLILFLLFIVGLVGILGQEIRKERVFLELRSYADDKPLNANKL